MLWKSPAMPWCSSTVRASPSGFCVATAMGRPAATKSSRSPRIPGYSLLCAMPVDA